MRWRWPLYLINGVAMVGVLCAMLAGWTFTTERGTRLILDLASEWLPVTVSTPQGTLAQGLRAERVVFQSESVIVVAADISMQVDLWLLIGRGALDIAQFSAGKIEVNTLETDAERNEFSIPAPPLPVYLHLLQVGELTVDGQLIQDTTLVGAWTSKDLHIEALRFRFNALNIESEGKISTHALPAIEARLNWSQDRLSGRLTVAGTPREIAVDHEFAMDDLSVISAGTLFLAERRGVFANLTHDVSAYQASIKTVIEEGGPVWNVSISGTVQGMPVRVEASVDNHEGGWRARLSNGLLAEALHVKGYVGNDHAALDFAVQDIADLVPAVSGSVAAELTYDGSDLTLQASANAIQLNDAVTLGRPQLAGQYHIDEGSFNVQGQMSWLEGDDIRVDLLAAGVEGQLDSFRYWLNWPDTDFSGEGSYVGDVLKLSAPEGSRFAFAGNSISLTTPLDVNVGRHGLSLTRHCWVGLVRICGQGTLETSGALAFHGTVSVQEVAQVVALPLTVSSASEHAVFASWRLLGTVDAPAVEASGLLAALSVMQDDISVSLPALDFAGSFTESELKAQFAGSHEYTSISGNVTSQNFNSIAGHIRVDADLERSVALPDGLLLSGQASTALSVAGSIDELLFQGEGNWSGDVTWHDQGLTQIDANLQFSNAGWQVSGTGMVPQGGHLELSGRGDGFSLSSDLVATVKGENLSIADDVWAVTADPDVELRMKDGSVEFDGLVRVPMARAEIRALPASLPKPSRDVLVRNRTAEADDLQGWRGTVRVVLGDDVRLKLLLLDIALTGQLDAEVIGEEVLSLQGELRIPSGVLQARGQTLSITEGRVKFSGDPNNPFVDVVAVREIDNVSPKAKVGLRMVGLSDELVTTVYSEPPMNEARALSLLVTGRDLAGGSNAQSKFLLNAALGFGIQRSAAVVQELRNRVGLDELTAFSNEHNEVAIVAGKQISENLHVRYTYNALSALGALVIRYHLSERWRLEATNDQTSSMDLLYEFSQ